MLLDSFPVEEKKVLYGIATDSIYKQMLYESDNFLAEQLLMVGSSPSYTSVKHLFLLVRLTQNLDILKGGNISMHISKNTLEVFTSVDIFLSEYGVLKHPLGA